MKKALSTILVVATLCEETLNAGSWFSFDLDVVHSLRRHYPDQVRRVDGNCSRPLSQAFLAPPAPSTEGYVPVNLGLTGEKAGLHSS